MNHPALPPPADWSPVAVRLLQGVVYHDDNLELWEQLLENVSPLSEYFAKLGLHADIAQDVRAAIVLVDVFDLQHVQRPK